MSEILLMRHCESSGQAPAAALTERGRAQARSLAAFLAAHPVDHLISSPYLRARETIAPFASGGETLARGRAAFERKGVGLGFSRVWK
jgi:2,3-bisphosphoglycerate-dependent phosphoglycerate mutase